MEPEKLPSLTRLAGALDGAVRALGTPPSPETLERWTLLVHRCMSGMGRSFHDVAHAFDVAASDDPVAVLAGLFHDTVYYQIDGGLAPSLEFVLGEALTRAKGLRLAAFDRAARPEWVIVLEVFGRAEGEVLTTYDGLNELLSALLAARLLAGNLPPAAIAELAVCIELTIPFRRGPESELAGRLARLDRAMGLGLGAAGIDRALRRAVDLAHRDVAGFALPDSGEFLARSWQLLPESNWSLRDRAYSLQEYRRAVESMLGFISALEPRRVFPRYGGHPEDAIISARLAGATRNIETARRYLRAKVLSARLMEQLAAATGGDVPVAMFLGDTTPGTTRIESYLPPPAVSAPDVDAEVFRLLVDGRPGPADFDIPHSPLSAFLYGALGDGETAALVDVAKSAELGALRARLPPAVLNPIIRAAAKLAVTRTAKLAALELG